MTRGSILKTLDWPAAMFTHTFFLVSWYYDLWNVSSLSKSSRLTEAVSSVCSSSLGPFSLSWFLYGAVQTFQAPPHPPHFFLFYFKRAKSFWNSFKKWSWAIVLQTFKKPFLLTFLPEHCQFNVVRFSFSLSFKLSHLTLKHIRAHNSTGWASFVSIFGDFCN